MEAQLLYIWVLTRLAEGGVVVYMIETLAVFSSTNAMISSKHTFADA